MMIIIEGPDNSGKSTLGEYLSKQLGTPLQRSEKPDPAWTPVQALEHSCRQLRPQSAIRDRAYVISEYVYGPICRGGSALQEYHPQAMFDLYSRPYLIIYCRPRSSTILRNGGREQMDGVLENHQRIIDGYDCLMEELARFSRCKILRYDWQCLGDRERVLHQAQTHLIQYQSGLYSTIFLGQGTRK
jgi:adenylate kinase family enzyme